MLSLPVGNYAVRLAARRVAESTRTTGLHRAGAVRTCDCDDISRSLLQASANNSSRSPSINRKTTLRHRQWHTRAPIWVRRAPSGDCHTDSSGRMTPLSTAIAIGFEDGYRAIIKGDEFGVVQRYSNFCRCAGCRLPSKAGLLPRWTTNTPPSSNCMQVGAYIVREGDKIAHLVPR